MEEDINISDLMESLMPPEIEALAQAVASGDPRRFDQAFGRFTAVCNACHRSTGHGFVVIGQPTVPLLSSQRYGDSGGESALESYGAPRVMSVQ